MKADDQKFVVHEGLTDLERMKLEMFRTVVRKSVQVVLVACLVILSVAAFRALAGAFGYRF